MKKLANLKNNLNHLGILFLGSGLALIVYITTHWLMSGILAVILMVNSLYALYILKGATNGQKSLLWEKIKIGLLAGLIATIVYDIMRVVFVKTFHLTFWPFDIFPKFGIALLGSDIPFWSTFVGVLYHLLNGVCFAVAYTIIFGKKGWWAGILWAFGLELLMLTFYPGWLGLKALGEFYKVSILGHFFYGIVLGYLAKRWLSNIQAND